MGFICHKGTSCLERGQASSRAERIWQGTMLFGVMSEAMTRRMHNTIDFILHLNIANMDPVLWTMNFYGEVGLLI